MRKLKSMVILAAAVSALLAAQAAVAQYPQPVGSLLALISDATPTTDEDVVVSGQAFGTDGNGLVNVPVTFTVLQDPGGDDGNGPEGEVQVGSKVVTKMTNDNGVASTILTTGSTPGIVVIGVESQGKKSTLIVEVTGPGAPAPEAASDAAPASEISPPNTGDGGLK